MWRVFYESARLRLREVARVWSYLLPGLSHGVLQGPDHRGECSWCCLSSGRLLLYSNTCTGTFLCLFSDCLRNSGWLNIYSKRALRPISKNKQNAFWFLVADSSLTGSDSGWRRPVCSLRSSPPPEHSGTYAWYVPLIAHSGTLEDSPMRFCEAEITFHMV